MRRTLGSWGRFGLLLVTGLALTAAKTRDSPSFTEGDWKIEAQGDKLGSIQLQLHREWSSGTGHSVHSSSFDLRREDLNGLRREDWTSDHADVTFDLVRDAGTLHFRGVMRHGRGLGEYTFEPDARFADEVERAGYGPATPDDLMRFAIQDIDRMWLRGFQGRHVSVDDLVRFKVHGVTPAFVNAMTAGGYRDLSADDIVRLKVHGVEADYIRSMQELTSPKPSVDDVIRMHIHGVETSYVKDLRDAGYVRLGADDLVRLKLHGVTPELARRARSRDRDLTADDLIRLKVRGQL